MLWYLYRNIETNRNKIFGDIINHNKESLNIIKRIKTLVYIDPDYVKDVFNLISEDAELIGEKEKELVNSYFKKTYIDKFNIHDWIYYKIYAHPTNNACKSYNPVLNSKFNIKPTF